MVTVCICSLVGLRRGQWEGGAGPAWCAWASVWADHPALLAGSQGATRKYKVWMRHRYHSCCNRLGELLAYPSFQVKVSLGCRPCLVSAPQPPGSPHSRGLELWLQVPV